MRYRIGFLVSLLLLSGGIVLNSTLAQQADNGQPAGGSGGAGPDQEQLFGYKGALAPAAKRANADQADPGTQPSHAGPTTSMRDAKTPAELAKVLQQRFDGATDDQLHKYMAGDDAGDAIAAGWETVRRSMSAAFANAPAPTASMPHSIVHPDKENMAHFLECVDARTGGAPTVWRNAVSSCWSYADKLAIGFSGIPGPLAQPNPVTVQRQGRNTIVIVDQTNQWTVPGQFGNASAALTDGVAYLAAYQPWKAPGYTLYAMDRKTNAVIWSSRVWAADGFIQPGGGSGVFPFVVDIKPSGDTIAVFGATYDGVAYIERFDLKTGDNLSRFCTKYYGDK